MHFGMSEMTNYQANFYFDDIAINDEYQSETDTLTEESVRAFAKEWDPLPIHLDEKAAKAAGLAGITASGSHLLAIKNKLLYALPIDMAVLASFGFDEVRFRRPGRPGDIVHLNLKWVEKRLSKSRPDQGIAKHHCELRNADGEVLLSLFDTVLIARRA